MKTSIELENAAAQHVAALMVAAARTAPKTRGIDNIKKSRGESTHDMHSLRMKATREASRLGVPPAPATLKLK